MQRLKPCAPLEAEALDVHGAPAVIVLHHRIGDAGVDGDEHLHLRLSVVEELRLAGLEIAIWLAVTFSMIPLIDVPGCSNFAPLLLCDSMLASICSGVMDTAGRAGG